MTSIQFSEIQNRSKTIKAKELSIQLPSEPVKYYRHGWQSWSLAAWTDLSPLPEQKPVIFHPLQMDAEYLNNQNPHGSWLGAVEFTDGNILLPPGNQLTELRMTSDELRIKKYGF